MSSAAGPICGICLSAIGPEEAKTACPDCKAEYHVECWAENGGCAVYGCAQVPVIEQRRAIEIPVSYWGRENKNCPKCGKEILAAAMRCRYCGSTFESARPQEVAEFQQRTELTQRLPAAKKMVMVLFILSVVTCLAPVGAVWGIVWYPAHKEELRSLPAVYGAVCKIGLAVGIGQTVALVVLTLLYAVVRR